jgi:hypothetical protein
MRFLRETGRKKARIRTEKGTEKSGISDTG